MKDIIITSKKLKQERNIFLLSFLLAFIINVIAIIIYSRPWIEIISQIGYVIVISFFFYLILWILESPFPKKKIRDLRFLKEN